VEGIHVAEHPLAQGTRDTAREASSPGLGRAVFEVDVECGAGHQEEPTPRRLRLGDRTIEVDVVDRWLAPDHRYFKVRGPDRATYIVRHDVGSGIWQLVLFDSRGSV
jgi:hypothetical protein